MSDTDPLNRPFSVHSSDIVTSLTCRCRLGNEPILLMSASVEAVCAHCGKRFVVMSVSYQQGGPMSVQIGMMAPQKPAAVAGPVGVWPPARG